MTTIPPTQSPTTTVRLDARTGLTCLACQLVFHTGQIQRDHYRSEWHLYNMKRQIANLEPISEHDFQTKLNQFSQQQKPSADDNSLVCDACRGKKFRSRAAFDNHLNSNKHKEAVEKGQKLGKPKIEKSEEENGEKDGEETSSSCEEEEFDSRGIMTDECLFCGSAFENWEFSLAHMALQHGFSIPDLPFCSDVPGLLKYLGLKIGDGLTCIRCQCARFHSLDALRKHMRDSNHCNFRIDGNAGEEGDVLLEFMDFYDYDEHGQYADEAVDGAVKQITTLYDEGGFLVLPSGARIGHRSLMRYFRQKLRPIRDEQQPQRAETRRGGGALAVQKLEKLGWTGATAGSSLAVAHARDVAFMKRAVQRYRLKRELAGNKLFKSRGRNDQQ